LDVVWVCDGENIFDCMMNMLSALAYPFCCMVVLYVATLSRDDHQCDWWEQMDEVLVVRKEMAIPLLSHLGWSLIFFPSWLFRAMTHVLPYALLLYSPVRLLFCSLGIVVCLELVGAVYETPVLHYWFIRVWRFF